MIKAALYGFVVAQPTVSAAIGDRFYPQVIPKQAWSDARIQPCAVYMRIGVQRGKTYCATDAVARSTFQIDAYALTPEEADGIARVIKSVLIDYRGMMGAVKVKDISLDGEFDLDDPEPGLYRVSMTISIWHDNE